MDQLRPGDHVLLLDGPYMGREATVEQVDQEAGLAHLRLELAPGHSVTIVEYLARLRRLDAAP
jgi:transcription antitermination factor NusG